MTFHRSRHGARRIVRGTKESMTWLNAGRLGGVSIPQQPKKLFVDQHPGTAPRDADWTNLPRHASLGLQGRTKGLPSTAVSATTKWQAQIPYPARPASTGV